MLVDHKEETLLALRKCARGFPVTLARELGIPRTTARDRIQILEQEGIVTEYTPVVNPKTFGSPYLIQIDILLVLKYRKTIEITQSNSHLPPKSSNT